MTNNTGGRAGISRGEFVQNLAESGLLDLSDLLPDSEPNAAVDGGSAARELVAAGRLTDYQADAVLARRFADLRIGNYEILDRLGAGGMGTVYKARHRRMKRVVALKVLSKEVAASGRFVERFQREVETIARLRHTNIVMAYDADECESGPFLVMEFVNGRDLASEVEKAGPMSAVDAVDRILQAARGLEYAHAQGIVHRDIKPGNILHDIDGVVKVADLGLARLNAADGGNTGSTSLTQAGTVVGTAEYMSTEQAIDSGQVDHRADIYSLGCTLHFLLTGQPPYQAASIMGMLLKHRDATIPALRDTRPNIPPELESCFQRMIAKAPKDRYQTMSEVVAELERIQMRMSLVIAPIESSSPRLNIPVSQPAGTLVYNPTENPGSLQDTGHFDLSLTASPESLPPQPPQTVYRTVILVEPSRTQSGIIRRYLQQLGIDNVHVTGSGQEALELAKKVQADVIVSSMHLTDMTGVQLATLLLADSAHEKIGFVLATSEADSQEAGAIPISPRVVLMPKPFDPNRLAQSIAEVVGG